MKNQTKRNKILLAIGGVVIVVIVTGLLLLGPGEDLSGTTIIHITPENPTISRQSLLNMYINSVGNCDWTTSNIAIVSLYSYDPSNPIASHTSAQYDTKLVQVYGVSVGQAVITAKCAIFTRHTTVTVH